MDPSLRHRGSNARQTWKRRLLTALVLLPVAILPMHGCNQNQGGANLKAFNNGKSFLNSVRFNENPEINRFYRAFAKAGVILPPALKAVLSGTPVIDDGIKEARKAAANQLSGDNPSLRAAGVPRAIPLVDAAQVGAIKSVNGAPLAMNDSNNDSGRDSNIDASNSGGSSQGPETVSAGGVGNSGGGAQQAQCAQVNATCHAKAVAVAAAFACAFASAWACVYSEVQPFRNLCTWAYAGACTAAMTVAVSDVHASTSIEVCNMCPAGGGNMATPTPSTNE